MIIVAVISISASAMAQQTNYVYCELVGTQKLLSTKVNVRADYGQKASWWRGVDYIADENGKKVDFNSMVDAMNYMGSQGWEFVQAYVVTIASQNVYHWLLKKTITTEEKQKLSEDLSKGE